ncbi:D-alanyl-D-alanine carboxypeptidase family protein [Mahella australiensis]|uniref:serine-type D-Ala-D-Ala carboxypeptidase n=1 Tax=Mahella australiensis (strain DSM 15567 / CIP 107919 / 50-1 BON) TaxID=697281 RepID=F3ZXX2_MAHA5|nr:D-alanyl-D-alanine carboxypeptidase family protein [Mahella australiensis]AEE96642.1 Serine-type D-Ala-D-Ala carboxypeptidase [Mahella australiensis 50-1 BON]
MNSKLYKGIFIVSLCLALLNGAFIGNIAAAHEPNEQDEQPASEDPLKLQSKSAVLMDAATGQLLYEKNAHEKLPIASITKIMTMDLIMEALDSGRIKPTDVVRVSKDAASLGGSQIWLEEGEEMTVDEMMKAIAVNSANDAAAAMAEYIAGTQENFVKMMNEKAKSLGMNDTNFANVHGLDDDNHYSSAYDVALMSRELAKHDGIFKYTSIWMDTLRDGETNLANTNKLIRTYGADGLKTGSTDKAKYCISATAKKDDMRLIAVILGGPTSQVRFDEAAKLLDYGFNTFTINRIVKKGEIIRNIRVTRGKSDQVNGIAADDLSVLTKKTDTASIEKRIELPETIEAPVVESQKIGKLTALKGEQEVGSVDIIADKPVERASVTDILKDLLAQWF